jgi:hypothetical protein
MITASEKWLLALHIIRSALRHGPDLRSAANVHYEIFASSSAHPPSMGRPKIAAGTSRFEHDRCQAG